MDIFETHCHLNDDQLYGRIDEIIDRARQAGVSKLLVVGWDYESSLKAIKIAEEYLIRQGKTDNLCRFDVIEIQDGKINHIENAFFA